MKTIYIIDLQGCVAVNDLRLLSATARLNRAEGLSGVIISSSKGITPPATSLYCSKYDIGIVQAYIETLDALRKFYLFLKPGRYLQTKETIHQFLYMNLEGIMGYNDIKFHDFK